MKLEDGRVFYCVGAGVDLPIRMGQWLFLDACASRIAGLNSPSRLLGLGCELEFNALGL
jgi:hypothetical protein